VVNRLIDALGTTLSVIILFGILGAGCIGWGGDPLCTQLLIGVRRASPEDWAVSWQNRMEILGHFDTAFVKTPGQEGHGVVEFAF